MTLRPCLSSTNRPTIDLETREALVQAINEFPGAVVLVSHDRHLIELVSDRLWLVADGTVRPFDGDLEEYERRVLDASASDNRVRATEATTSRRAARRLAAERRRELEPLRQRARRAEEALARLTKERDSLDRALAEPQAAGTDGIAVAEVLKRRAEIVRLIERAERDWLAAEEAMERNAG